ncbi:MAG: prepilin-type N-terminal cleavage/methylation domain-containing protein [Hyphomonadaceae bacterium]|nr:prepilin-type N-terminal cleavage/methylation domain-containing protein [Clostridia bacterium]
MRFTRIIGNEKGFSLVELIVVIAIIAALSAIAMPNALNILSNSKRSTCVSGRATAVHHYYRYHVNGGTFNPHGTTGTQFLVDAKLLNVNTVCKSGGTLTWAIAPGGDATLTCSVHGN